MHRGEFLLVYKLFYLKGQKKTGFYIGIVLYPHKNVLLGNRSEKDNLEVFRNLNSSIILRQYLPMQINGGGKNVIEVKNVDTSNTYIMGKIKIDNKIHM